MAIQETKKELKSDFRLIWKYLKPYKKEIYKISFLSLISSIISAIIPIFYGKLIDAVQVEYIDISLIYKILVAWLFLTLGNTFLKKIVLTRSGYLGITVYTDLIHKIANHIIRLPLSFHKREKIGQNFSKIMRASTHLKGITDRTLPWIVPQFLTAIIGIGILFFISWPLAIGAVVFCLGFVLITLYKTKSIVATFRDFVKVDESISGNLHDILSNVQIVKSCTSEVFQDKKIKADYGNKFSSVAKKYRDAWIALSFWQNLFVSVYFVALFGLAIYLLINNYITVGQFVMFFAYYQLIQRPLWDLSYNWQGFKDGVIAIKRVDELLEIKQEEYEGDNAGLKEIKGEIEFRGVDFNYEDKETKLILENISFIVQTNEVVALVGKSGEGKTTLVNLISRYLEPVRGDILIDGVNIKDFNLKFLRDSIAYIPQEITLFNDTIENNIRVGNMLASKEDIIEASKKANAHQFIEDFPNKYAQIVGERGIKLSTGQKQRVAIARALIRNPKILILDEATASLDVESEKLVQEALKGLMKGRTTIIIAHRLSTIKNADIILVLDSGKIVEMGDHKELMNKKGLYAKFYDLQFKDLIIRKNQ